jgi:hypothetical protein
LPTYVPTIRFSRLPTMPTIANHLPTPLPTAVPTMVQLALVHTCQPLGGFLKNPQWMVGSTNTVAPVGTHHRKEKRKKPWRKRRPRRTWLARGDGVGRGACDSGLFVRRASRSMPALLRRSRRRLAPVHRSVHTFAHDGVVRSGSSSLMAIAAWPPSAEKSFAAIQGSFLSRPHGRV